MSNSEQREPTLSEVTGSFHYQELIESRLGQPIASDMLDAEVQRLASSPGAHLAAGRQASSWSVEQVAAQLKLAPRQVLALEKDDYAALPEAAIVKGFTRAYAKLLKLDPEPILALLAKDLENKKIPDHSKTVASKTQNLSKPGGQNRPFPLALVLLLCALTALAYAYFSLQH